MQDMQQLQAIFADAISAAQAQGMNHAQIRAAFDRAMSAQWMANAANAPDAD